MMQLCVDIGLSALRIGDSKAECDLKSPSESLECKNKEYDVGGGSGGGKWRQLYLNNNNKKVKKNKYDIIASLWED